jgi:hypothetical protein
MISELIGKWATQAVGRYGPPQDFDKNWNYSFELPVQGARGTLHWQDPDFTAYIVLSL